MIDMKPYRGKKIYLAGPMTSYGKERNYNWDAFYNLERYMSSIGIYVENPARITDEMGGQDKFVSDKSFREKVINLQQECVKASDCIFLLKGWEYSVGARNELKIALENDLEIILEK